jgi:hypothetical protein
VNGQVLPATPEQAAHARAARAEKRRREAERAIAERENGSLRSAWQKVVVAQYERATGIEAHTPAASFVARSIGAFVEVQQGAVSEASLPVELQAVTQWIRAQSAADPALVERLTRLARGEVAP